jgi:type I restriction enzyme S subunit
MLFDSLFLGYSLNSSNSIAQKMMMAKGEIIVHIYGSKLKELIIPLPPIKEEQQLIVNYIEENNQKIDKAIDLQQQQVTKLKEYKTTLIDSVVTGKVRVI